MTGSVATESFDDIAERWEELLPRCWTDTVFVTHVWQSVWWRSFGETYNPVVLSVRDGGRDLGIAPLMIRDGVLSFIGDADLFDYHDFLVLKGCEDRFYEVLFEHLADLEWERIELKSVPQSSPTLRGTEAAAARVGLGTEVQIEDVTPAVLLPDTWEGYLSTLARKDRHELRRKLRRLHAAGTVRQSECPSPGAHDDCMNDFFRLMRASSQEKADFLTPERERFFRAFAAELAPRGTFRLYFLEVDGTRVASCICFDHSGSYLLYNSGYDPEYSPLSVGLLNKALCIKEAIEEGRRAFDFLRGSERYKYDLGGTDRLLYRITVRR